MYKQLLGLMIIFLSATKAHSLCGTDINPVNFTATMASALSDNSYLQLSSQIVQASSAQPISGCILSGKSNFTMRTDTSLLTSSRIDKDGLTYYQIPSNYIAPRPNFDVYIAYSVKDNQDNAQEIWVNNPTTEYTIFSGISNTRGIRLQNVHLLVSGIGNIEGIYTINNLTLGSLNVTSGIFQSASTIIKLSNSTFRITKTTCVVNGGASMNVTLPTVRTAEFTSIGKTLGETAFAVNVRGCNASDVNKSLIALLTDNASPGSNNDSGLLKNIATNGSPNVSVQITDSNSIPLQISPKLLDRKENFINFGIIGAGGTISKIFKARYYSNAIPVPATEVKAQAIITLIYN